MKRRRMLSMVLIVSVVMAGRTLEIQAAKKMTKTSSDKYSLASTNTALTNQNVRIKVNKKKGAKVKQILWRKGKITKTGQRYWKKGKNITKTNMFSATSNGWYSVRVTDKKNRVMCKTIQVTNIDKFGPIITNTYSVSNKVATISAFVGDSPSGVSYVGYAKGFLREKKNLSVYTAVGGATTPVMVPVGESTVPATHQFTVDTPGYYTICARDAVGNVSLNYVYVELWRDLTSVAIFDKYAAGHYEGTVYDRWENIYSNPVGLEPYKDGKDYVEYSLNGAYKNLSGTIMRGKGIDDLDVVWLEILADDVVVYTSAKMDYKTQAISFDIPINNARYLKIRAYSAPDNSCRWDTWDSERSHGVYIIDGKLYN